MTQPRDLDWLFKCRQCRHYYQVQADADEVRCRLKYCRYEPSDKAEKYHELLGTIIEAGRKVHRNDKGRTESWTNIT